MEVLSQNAELIGSAASVVMALIWAVYLQLFFQDYRSRRRPRLLIQQADAPRPEEFCALVNMSTMHLDILCVQVVVQTEEGTVKRQLHQAEHEVDAKELTGPQRVKEGPIQPGGKILLGSFRELLDWAVGGESNASKIRPKTLEIRVVFFHGLWDQPHGSSRSFALDYADGEIQVVRPTTLHTVHLSGRRGRHRVEQWYQDVLDEATQWLRT